MRNMEGNLEENFEGKLNGRTGGPLCRGTLGVPHQEANMGGHFVGLPFCGGFYMGPIVSSIQDFLHSVLRNVFYINFNCQLLSHLPW